MPGFPDQGLEFTRRAAIRLALAGSAAGSARASGLRQLLPPQQQRTDAALDDLILRMRRMVSAKDSRALESLMLPTFRVEFDAGKGPAAFRNHWKPDRSGSALWEVLGRVLDMKGTWYSDTLFGAPYVSTQFPFDLDPLAHVVALGPKVALFDKPADGARQVGSLDHAIVPLAQPLNPPVLLRAASFLEVKHPEAGLCWVQGSGVYSPAAHRVFFEKRRGKWRWFSLAAATLAEPPDLIRLQKRSKPG